MKKTKGGVRVTAIFPISPAWSQLAPLLPHHRHLSSLLCPCSPPSRWPPSELFCRCSWEMKSHMLDFPYKTEQTKTQIKHASLKAKHEMHGNELTTTNSHLQRATKVTTAGVASIPAKATRMLSMIAYLVSFMINPPPSLVSIPCGRFASDPLYDTNERKP